MIVDVKITGTLAKGAGCLIIFEDHKTDAIYPSTIKTISKVVDSMFVRSVEDNDLKVSSVEFCLFYPLVAHSLLVLLTVFFFLPLLHLEVCLVVYILLGYVKK